MKLAHYITTKMIKYHLINTSDEELYLYGLINGFILITNFLTVMILSLFLKKQDDIFILLISFIPLRSFSGGFHCKTKTACYIVSTLTIIISLEIQNFFINHKLLLLFICILSTIYILITNVKSSSNRRIDKYEVLYFETMKKRILYLLLVFLILFTIIGKIMYTLDIMSSIILVAILLFLENLQTHI